MTVSVAVAVTVTVLNSVSEIVTLVDGVAGQGWTEAQKAAQYQMARGVCRVNGFM